MKFEDVDALIKRNFPCIPGRISFQERRSIAIKVASSINNAIPFRRETTESLPASGFVKVKTNIDDDVINYFNDKVVFNAHTAHYSDGILRPISQNETKICCHTPEDILRNEVILDVLLDDRIVNLAYDYLGCCPTVFSVNSIVYLPDKKHVNLNSRATQDFHRDYDDFRSLAFFVYMNDVDTNGGPHVFKASTHFDVGDGPEIEMIGKLGDGFVEDAYGLHRGKQTSKKRWILWFRYGLYANPIYYLDKNDSHFITSDQVRKLTDEEQYIIRLFVRN
jgi:hypothetical protein